MFTGIIEETGTVSSIRAGSRASVMTVSATLVTTDMKVGDSINTDGVCLTVVSFTPGSFTADVMPETMDRSGLGKLKPGSRVNLERALRLSDRLGGHLVSGHIDDTGIISGTRKDENALWITVRVDKKILRYIVEKGSVAIDGISLTVARADDHTFDVSVIPHTASVTTLVGKKTGDSVNIECDLIAKYLEKIHLSGNQPRIDLEFLAKNDFI